MHHQCNRKNGSIEGKLLTNTAISNDFLANTKSMTYWHINKNTTIRPYNIPRSNNVALTISDIYYIISKQPGFEILSCPFNSLSNTVCIPIATSCQFNSLSNKNTICIPIATQSNETWTWIHTFVGRLQRSKQILSSDQQSNPTSAAHSPAPR